MAAIVSISMLILTCLCVLPKKQKKNKADICIFSWDQAALQMVFSVCLSVRPSVRLSHLFDYVPIIVSSWNFILLLPMTKVRSMQKVKVKGQGHRGHNPT